MRRTKGGTREMQPLGPWPKIQRLLGSPVQPRGQDVTCAIVPPGTSRKVRSLQSQMHFFFTFTFLYGFILTRLLFLYCLFTLHILHIPIDNYYIFLIESLI